MFAPLSRVMPRFAGSVFAGAILLLVPPHRAMAAPQKGLAWKYEPSAFVGINATQVTIAGSGLEAVSDGYNGFAGGVGLAALPKTWFAAEADVFYTHRSFGFGTTKGGFNTLQIPITAQLRMGPTNLGGGFYTALWNFKGEIVQNGAAAAATASSAGHASTEYGVVGLAAFKTPVKGIPLRFEFRFMKSMSDIASSSEFKGSLVEYQFLIGYDFGAAKGSKKK
jgi:hypothetical protein